MSVDGRDISGLPLSQVVERISGPVGSEITLGILDAHNFIDSATSASFGR